MTARQSTNPQDPANRELSPVVREMRRLRARVAELEQLLSQATIEGFVGSEPPQDDLAPKWTVEAARAPVDFADAWSCHEDVVDVRTDTGFFTVGCVDEQARSWLFTGS